jgi:hypothetical protein
VLLRRFNSVACVWLGVLTAILPVWCLLIALVNMRVAANRPKAPSPNPAMAPGAFLDPNSAMVFVDPWFAGTIGYWWWLCLSVVVAASVMVFAIRRTTAPTDAAPSLKLTTVYLLSLLLGALFASPWIYGTILFFWTPWTN